MGNIKLLLAIGNSDIELQINKLKGINIIDSDSDIDIISDILNYEKIDFVIVNTLLSIKKSLALAQKAKEKNVKIIALVEDKSDKELIPALVGAGVYAFLELDELFLIHGYIDDYPQDFNFKGWAIEKNLDKKSLNSGEEDTGHTNEPGIMQKLKTTVAVIGSMGRIGTTTQAIGMTKFLVDRGFKACYIEANGHNYIEEMVRSYDGVEENDELGKITYADIDMFYRTSEIGKVLKMPYQYFIYDYGNIHEIGAEISWQEKDIRILCAGTKPNELRHLQPVFQMIYEKGAKYIYSFSPEDEHNEVRSLMAQAAKDTFFSNYTPDPFRTNMQSEVYEQILEVPIGTQSKVANSAKGANMLFGKLFKRGRNR